MSWALLCAGLCCASPAATALPCAALDEYEICLFARVCGARALLCVHLDYRGLVAVPPFHVFISGGVARCPFPGSAEQLDLHLPLAEVRDCSAKHASHAGLPIPRSWA
jgi:hypothetical protein